MACGRWDSRFSQNYRFGVNGPTTAVDRVIPRAGAAVSLEMVNAFWESASKVVRLFDDSPTSGRELQTRMSIKAWVRNVAYHKDVWIDVHVLDSGYGRVQAATFGLQYREQAGGGGDFFTFDDLVYRGSGAVPGSVWFNPDARHVQYRLYYQVNGRVYTDGLLHAFELETDDHVWNPH
jgi:hypothetical protein